MRLGCSWGCRIKWGAEGARLLVGVKMEKKAVQKLSTPRVLRVCWGRPCSLLPKQLELVLTEFTGKNSQLAKGSALLSKINVSIAM